MFPTLVQGWTDEGTAVLNLKGNIEQLRDAYKEAQQEAYNLLIVSGKDSDGNDIIKQWEDTHDTGFWADLLDLGADDVGGGIAVSDALKQLKAIQNMTAEEYREIERITGAGSRKEIAGLSDIEKDIGYGSYLYKALGLDSNVTDEAFREAQRQARALIQTYNAEIESALSDVETLANAYLMTNEDYDKLDEQSKTAASMLVNSLNADIANTFSSKEDVGVYVDKIVQSILSNSKAKDALKGLFTMDTSDMSVDEIKKQTDSYINTIAEVLKEDPIELKTRLGFDDSDTQPLINNVKEKLQGEFADKVGELTLDELKIAADLEVSEKDLLSWDELKAKIKEVQSSASNIENPISSTTDILSQVESLSKGLDQLDKIYADVYDKGDFDWSSILNSDEFKQTFSELGQVYEDFIETISNSPNDISACQSSFNNLATSYIYNSGVLDNLTEETKASTVAMLEQMGVANATGMVEARLAAQKEITAKCSKELSELTLAEIAAIIKEGIVSEETAGYLQSMAIEKIAVNGVTINSEADVNNILAIAKAAGMGAIELAKLKNALNEINSSGSSKMPLGASDLLTGNSNKESNNPLEEKLKKKKEQEKNNPLLVDNNDNKNAEDKVSDIFKKLRDEMASLNEYDYFGNFTGGSTTQKAIDDAAKSAKDAAKSTKDAADTVKEAVAETFDFIENGIDLFEKNLSKLEDKANNTGKSFKSRAQAYEEALKGVSFGMELLSDDYNKYMTKANSIGLDESIAQKIRGGDSNIWDYTDDNLKQQIKDYETWYKKAQGCLDKIEELKQKQVELSQQSIELIITQYEKFSPQV